MLPIKYKDLDFISISDASLFTLVDKETQTDTNSVPKKPGEIEQTVSYGKLRERESRILNASISKEKKEQHKNEVLSAKSSHSTLFGNIFQRESCSTPTSNKDPAWKLEESFAHKDLNSGYEYTPYIKTENVSNKGSVIISNQPICPNTENCEQNTLSNKQSILISKQETYIDVNIIEDNCEKELTEHSSIKNVKNQNYPKTDNGIIKENTDVNLNKDNKEFIDDNPANNVIETDNRILKENFEVNVNIDTDKKKIGDKNSSRNNNEKPCTETVNSNIKENSDVNLIIGNGEKEFSDVSFVESLNEKKYLKKNNSNGKANTDSNIKSNHSEQKDFYTKTSQEKMVTSVSFKTNPAEETCSNTRNSKENVPGKINNSSPLLTLGLREDCLDNLAQGMENCLSITLPVAMNPNIIESCAKSKKLELENEKENKVELCEEEKGEKTKAAKEINKSLTNLNNNLKFDFTDKSIEIKPEKNPPDSPSKASGLKTNLKGESSQTMESGHLSPLVDEMRPNNEFVSEDFVFNDSGQQPPIDLDVTADEYSEETTSLTSTHNVDDSDKLTAKSPRTPDEYPKNMGSKVTEHVLNINDTSIYEEQSLTINNRESIGPMIITKLMGGAGSVVESLNKHINLDRISYFQKKDELVTNTDERSTDFTLSHSYVPTPAGYLATLKSAVLGFFSTKPVEPSNTMASSSSDTSSELSDDETDPVMM